MQSGAKFYFLEKITRLFNFEGVKLKIKYQGENQIKIMPSDLAKIKIILLIHKALLN